MFGTIDGTGYEILDPIFEDYIIGHAKIELFCAVVKKRLCSGDL